MTYWPTDHLYTESYEALFPPNEAETELLLQRASDLGGPILDAGCGSGRLLVALAEVGHTVVGVESSWGQWGLLQRRLQEQPSEVASQIGVEQQDMFAMHLSGQFGICFSNSWYLTDDDAKIAGLIRSMSFLLKDNGRVILSDFSWMQTIRRHYLGKPSRRAGRARDGSTSVHVKTYHYEDDAGILRANVILEKHSLNGDSTHRLSYSWIAKYIDDRLFAALVDEARCCISDICQTSGDKQRLFELKPKHGA